MAAAAAGAGDPRPGESAGEHVFVFVIQLRQKSG
jgi:hypothetical protein